MNVNFNGFGENAATFIADKTITEAGVKVKSDKKIAVGYKKLSATADGGVSVTTTGREYLVLDSTDTSVGFIL